MSGGFAGRLRERVTIERPAARDALGAAGGGWTAIGADQAALAPAGTGPLDQGGARTALPLWKVEMRARDLAPGDRIGWAGGTMIVRSVTRDPALPDRIAAIAEETR